MIVNNIFKRKGIRQLLKFSIVGFFNALLDWTLFYLLSLPLSPKGQLGKQIAKGLSFLVSSTSSYYFNRRWTFRSQEKKIVRQATMYYAVATVGLILNNLIFYITTSEKLFGYADIVGLFIATGIVAFWNFIINKYWTFK